VPPVPRFWGPGMEAPEARIAGLLANCRLDLPVHAALYTNSERIRASSRPHARPYAGCFETSWAEALREGDSQFQRQKGTANFKGSVSGHDFSHAASS